MSAKSPGRNAPCPCGSGRKYKKCCGAAPAVAQGRVPPPSRVPARPALAGSHLQLLVSLDDLAVPVWRRLLLRRDATFADLHQAIQACGWNDAHLWWFVEPIEGHPIAAGPGLGPELVPDPALQAHRVLLRTWLGAAGAACIYEYDFGDGWLHTVRLEATVQHAEDFPVALLDGRGRFPPEDCGGVPGYGRILQYVATGQDPWGQPESLADLAGGHDLESFTRIDLDRERTRVGGPRLPAPPRDTLPEWCRSPLPEFTADAEALDPDPEPSPALDGSLIVDLQFRLAETVTRFCHEYGLHSGGVDVRYTEDNARFKAEIARVRDDGVPMDRNAEAFLQRCFEFDLRPGDLGARFEADGRLFQVIGLRPRARHPVVCRRRDPAGGRWRKVSVPARFVRNELLRTRS